MKKVFRFFLLGTACIVVMSASFLFVGKGSSAENIAWGVNFSAKHAEALGLDWRAVYTAILDELEVRYVKISIDWNEIERERDIFSFEDADWQTAEAEKRNVKVMLVVGMKTLRWPECHVPEWAEGLSKKEQQKEVLELMEAVVLRYKDSPAVTKWQVENEPFFPFGDCPWKDSTFLQEEIDLVKSLDPNHPIVISDTGEFSFWVAAARAGDIVSPTMYRRVWFHELNRYVTYPLPPTFYGRKSQAIRMLLNKEVIGGELQAEPWGPGKLLYDTAIEEQDAAFNLAQFQENIEFAKQTGIAEHYLWGVEWWYWRLTKHNDSQFWNQAQKLFNQNSTTD